MSKYIEQDKFYKTQAWKDTRAAYLHSVGGLCEVCKSKGMIQVAEIVHHKIHLDKEQINNPEIALSWNNLQALCRNCHAAAHPEMYHSSRPYKIDEMGHIIIKENQ